MFRPWAWFAVAVSLMSTAAVADPLPYPRLANMFWVATLDSARIQALSQWDVVVVNPVWTQAQLSQLRALNPDIRIFFYVIAYTVELPTITLPAWKQANHDYAAANDLWWYDKNLGIGSDWPNTRMVNLTEYGPVGPQGTWRDFFAAQVESLMIQFPDLDGIFLDNFWKQLSWQQQFRQLDSDCNPTHNPAGCNGVADTNAGLDSLWNAALRDLATDIRARFDVLQVGRPRPLVIWTNNATDYFESLNGAMVEYFPSGHSNVDYDIPYGYNWNEEMLACSGGYLVAPFNPNPELFQVLNGDYIGSVWAPARSPEYERLKRFTLVSALLGDGYYSLDAGGASGHGNLWWEPEYDHAGRGKGYLGQPLGPMVRLLQPTGPELVQNSDFSAGQSAWIDYGFGATGSVSTDATTFAAGPPSMRIDVESVTPGGQYKVWQSPVPLVHHQAYTLRFWARASGPQEIAFEFYAESCPNQRCWNTRRFCVDSTWRPFEMSFHSSGTADAGLNIFVTQPGSVWLDDVSLRTGDTSLFRRDFDHGAVFLNYTATIKNIPLGDTFWELKIPNSFEFNGEPVTSLSIPPADARIVLRDSTIDPPDTTSVSDVAPGTGWRAELFQNEPNPFNPATEIRFRVDSDMRVHLAIFDVAGRRVRILADGRVAGGALHRVRWDGTDDRGTVMPSGVYVYRLSSATTNLSRKMILVR